MVDYNPSYINEVASTIFDQIKATTSWSERGSWGAHSWQATLYKGMPALAFRCSGLLHKGWVYVAYNEGIDVYEVFLINTRGREMKHVEEVYCDELGWLLDKEIERGEMPEDVYYRKAMADSERKMSASRE